MIVTTLILLIVFDAALLFAFIYLNKRQGLSSDLLAEITEERRLISELSDSLKAELKHSQVKSKENLDKVAHLAAEAEQEVKNSGHTLAKNMEELFSEFSDKFENPLKELAKRQSSMEALNKKIQIEKASLSKLLERAETLIKFFDNHLPYEEVIKDIESKKYADARSLLAKGVAPEKVALELGMSSSEVQLVRSLY